MHSARLGARSGACAVVLALSVVGLMAGPAYAVLEEGQPDPTFGPSGHRFTQVGSGADEARAVAVQPDGKVVAAGYAADGAGILDTAVVRYKVDGSPDTTFDGDGKQVTPVLNTDDQAEAVAIQSDGKIILAGSVGNGNDADFEILRYKVGGSLDATFDSDGIATLDIGDSTDRATALAIQPDGKILVAGYSFNLDNSNSDIAIVRYKQNGSLDGTFGSGGIKTTTAQLGLVEDRATSMALQPDGKILVAGYSVNVNEDTTIVRIRANGSFDPSFGEAGTPGIRVDNFGGDDRGNGVAVRPDGGIVVVGYLSIPNPVLLVVNFPSNGTTEDDRYPYVDRAGLVATGVALQPDGKIVASATGGSLDVPVVRLTSSGGKDGAFGIEGLGGGSGFVANAVALGPQGKIVVAGRTKFESSDDFAVARYVGDVTPPWGARMIGVPRYSLAKSRTVSWTASDTGTGVEEFDVQRRQAGFDDSTYVPWSTWLSKTPNVFGTFTGSPGSTYCLQVRGRDFAGNVGAYSPPSCEAIPLDERSMSASGSWTNLSGSQYYLGTAMSSTTAGAKLSVHARYRHLAVVVTTCPGCGTLKAYRGTTPLATIDLASSTTRHKRVIEIVSTASVQDGVITLRQASAGKKVVVEGLAVSLA
jgi:uncharacterized delta-60 repeat protein